MSDEVRIRPAAPADLPAYTRLFNDPSVIHGTMQIAYTSMHERARGFQPSPEHRILVAELDGHLAGTLNFHLNTGRRSHVGSFGMGVLGEFQGRGVGSALVEAVLDLADNWYNVRRMELEVYVDNAVAVRLYKRFGFGIEGRLRAYGYRDGRYVDVYAMARIRR